jgi:hypothetical protein
MLDAWILLALCSMKLMYYYYKHRTKWGKAAEWDMTVLEFGTEK